MKFPRFFILLPFALFLIAGCSEDNVTPPTNSIEFTYSNLKPLDQNVEGVYEAWLSVETSFDHDDAAYRSLGRFNISSSGSLVDTSGNPFSLKIHTITSISLTEDALITIEPPGDNDTIPGNIRLIGGAKSTQGSTIVFNMAMNYSEVLGSIASQFPGSFARYLLSAPTTGDTAQFNRGVWFSLDIGGGLPGLTLSGIPDTMDWTYQGWVIDSRDSLAAIYNMGRFDSPSVNDGFNQCQGSFPPWNVPGQDWIQPNCPGTIPDITDLNNGFYRLLVTLEPRFEQGSALSKPFYIKLFYGNLEQSSYGTILTLANVSSAYLPTAVIRLSAN